MHNMSSENMLCKDNDSNEFKSIEVKSLDQDSAEGDVRNGSPV
jgi:hypothetical protein